MCKIVLPLLLLLGLTGCATTMSDTYGPIELDTLNGKAVVPIIQLIVTTDSVVVEEECMPGAVGCTRVFHVPLRTGPRARLISVVRYTEFLPTQYSFDIELHELCHVAAQGQPFPDPCHNGNNGVIHRR